MKLCALCNENKSIDAFNKQSKAPDGLQYWCNECTKKYSRDRYSLDIEKSRQNTRDALSTLVAWIQGIKSNTPCKDCGKIYEPYCMDYDHVPERGKKIKAISRMVLEHFSKVSIFEEIDKCDLVCLLCHNKRTFDRLNEKLGLNRKYNKRAKANILTINSFKDKPCEICHNKYENYNMQIDHINPVTKLYDVCQLKRRHPDILLCELKKCQVLCALCHRRKSIIEQKEKKYISLRPPIEIKKRKVLFYDELTNTKECLWCGQIKEGTIFCKDKNNKYGLGSYCFECFNKYRRLKRKENK